MLQGVAQLCRQKYYRLFKNHPDNYMNYINTVVDLFSSYPIGQLLPQSSHK